ncbi:MAG: cyclase family protein [Methanosarcinales archaeon]|nr:cyclase family protein [Methanosarcinales archaeon]
MKIIDISKTISPDMEMYPEDPAPVLTRILGLDAGDPYNVSKLQLGTHTGTHIDPPLHLFSDKAGVSEIPLEPLVGSARLIDMSGIQRPVEPGDIGKLHAEEILLIKGAQGGACLTALCAQCLVDNNIRTIGVDALSIGAPDEEYKVHHTLLHAGIVIIEGLELCDVEAGKYFFICLPLKIANGDGGPARAILISGQYPALAEY